jgi:hypothetical protein
VERRRAWWFVSWMLWLSWFGGGGRGYWGGDRGEKIVSERMAS